MRLQPGYLGSNGQEFQGRHFSVKKLRGWAETSKGTLK